MGDSWAQEGRVKKAKELSLAEVYAEREVGAPAKRKHKPYVIEYRVCPDMARHGWSWLSAPDSSWKAYRSYAKERQMLEALAVLQSKDVRVFEYRARPECSATS